MNNDYTQHLNLSTLRVYSEHELSASIINSSGDRYVDNTVGLTPESSFDLIMN